MRTAVGGTVGRRKVGRAVTALMALMSATLALASALHAGVALLGVGDRFPGAVIPEAVIAVVLAGAVAAGLAGARIARELALIATLLGVAGFLIGLRFTLADAAAGDIAYHFGGLAILLVITGLLVRDWLRD